MEGIQRSVRSLEQELRAILPKGSQIRQFPVYQPTESEGHYYSRLLQHKFTLLEDVVAALRKRIREYEQTDEDVSKLVTQYGSVAALLEENKHLASELDGYKWLDARFDTEFLTRHEHLQSEDVSYLKSVVYALQNELYAHTQALRYYNFEENSNLKLSVVINPEMLDAPFIKNHSLPRFDLPREELTSLRRLLDVKFLGNEDKEKTSQKGSMLEHQMEHRFLLENNVNGKDTACEEEFILGMNGQSSHDNRGRRDRIEARMQSLVTENTFLKEQLERYKEELSETRASCNILNEPNMNNSKLKELELNSRNLLNQVHKMNESLSRMENNFVFQEHLVQSLTKKRNLLFQQNAHLTKKLIRSRHLIDSQRKLIQHKTDGSRVLYSIAMGALKMHAQQEEQLPEGSSTTFRISTSQGLEFLYRDIFTLHKNVTQSAIRIQAWFRGIRERRRLLQDGKYILVIPRVSKSAEQSNEKQNNEIQITKSIDDSGRYPHSLKNNKAFVLIESLYSALSIIERDMSNIISSKNVLSMVKQEVQHWIKQETLKELHWMRKELEMYSTNILEQVHRYTHRDFVTRSVQTTVIQTSDRGLQSGIG